MLFWYVGYIRKSFPLRHLRLFRRTRRFGFWDESGKNRVQNRVQGLPLPGRAVYLTLGRRSTLEVGSPTLTLE